MHFATLFGRTLRQAPAGAGSLAEQLLWRAGMFRVLSNGEVALLPLGSAALHRLADALTTAMRDLSGQEIGFPITSTAPWLTTVAALAERDIDSYRQLPQVIWSWRRRKQQTRGRVSLLDLPTPTTLGWAALALEAEQAESLLKAARTRISTVMRHCGLDPVAEALLSEGTATVIVDSAAAPLDTLDCPDCGLRAPLDTAPLAPLSPHTDPAPPSSLVETPGAHTIAALADYLGIPTSATAKALFFSDRRDGEQRLVFAVVRGDREASLAKLAAAIDAGELVPASEEQIRACGAIPGYASPVGLENVLVVADLTVANGAPLVAGANRTGYHLRDVVYGRDWQATLVADIAQATAGDPCPRCGTARNAGRGVALGAIYPPQPTTLLAQAADGQNRPLLVAGIELDLEPLLHLVVERHADERGIVWPAAIAPIDAHVVTLGRGDAVAVAGQKLAAGLQAAGLRVLIDDRDERAGVKFNDADLIGAPWRLVISEKLLATDQVEVRPRAAPQATVIARADVIRWLRGEQP
ncbi:proline--tRNA ligase [Chloroflexus sp.]|uniref:proline--tRNA ligase n=1 Tax=Chloroflexus sp. TaxID=1904827 RepID=UPI00260C02D9|nr:YbaK/EbsC family protein [uncultured Chloroflexus sp.]